MSRFYAPPQSVRQRSICITGREAHHIRDVLRLRRADRVVVFDGTGREYPGIIEKVGAKEVVVDIESVRQAKSFRLPEIILVQAIPRLEKMDLIIQKATELGVDTIIPIETSRTVVRLREARLEARIERWRRIILEASKQCGRSRVPEVKTPVDLASALEFTRGCGLKIFACLYEGAKDLKGILANSAVKKIALFIGPEGDFTPQELDLAKSFGCTLVSLGPLTLRCDTAAIAGLAILNYQLNRNRDHLPIDRTPQERRAMDTPEEF